MADTAASFDEPLHAALCALCPADLDAPALSSVPTDALRQFASSAEPAALFLVAPPSQSPQQLSPSPSQSPPLQPKRAAAEVRAAVGREAVAAFAGAAAAAGVVPRAAVVKAAPLDAGRPVSAQVSTLTLAEGPAAAAIDALHALVRAAVAPLFGWYAAADAAAADAASAALLHPASAATAAVASSSARPGMELVKQKLAELDVALGTCRNSVRIDRVELDFHREIREVAARVAASAAGDGQQRRLRVDDIVPQKLEDPAFSNGVQACVNRWIGQLRKLVGLPRLAEMPEDSPASHEIAFWRELDAELKHVLEQMQQPEFECTMEVLKLTRRLVTASSFEELRIRELARFAEQVRQYLQDFPLEGILTSPDLKRLLGAVQDVATYLRDKTIPQGYGPVRLNRLFDAVGRATVDRVVTLLRLQGLMHVPLSEFQQLIEESTAVFALYSKEKERLHVKRQLMAPRDQQFHQTASGLAAALQRRLAAVAVFRRQHEELHTVVKLVLAQQQGESVAAVAADIESAMVPVRELDVIGASREQWEEALNVYEDKISRVEAKLISRLRESLAQVSDVEQMFQVFARYNPLFCRPRIRAAVQEHQTQLISRVRARIEALQDKYRASRQQHQASSTQSLTILRDLPATFSRVLWNMQIQRQLESLLEKVESVLGQNWDVDPEGQVLRAQCFDLISQLNPAPIVEEWFKRSHPSSFNIGGRILRVTDGGRRSARGVLALEINFDEEAMTWVREVRNLKRLQVDVSVRDVSVAIACVQRYPLAVTLRELLKLYNAACTKLSPEIDPLVAAFKATVQAKLREGVPYTWDRTNRVEAYLDELSDLISTFTQKVDAATAKRDECHKLVAELKQAPYEHSSFAAIVANLQRAVDDLSSFSNLGAWTSALCTSIEDVMLARLSQALEAWTLQVERASKQDSSQQKEIPSAASSVGGGGGEPEIVLPKVEISISIHGHEVTVTPHIEHVRISYYDGMAQWLGIVLSQKALCPAQQRVVSSAAAAATATPTTLHGLLNKLPSQALERALAAIEAQVAKVTAYVRTWLQYQTLWAVTPQIVEAQFGSTAADGGGEGDESDSMLKWQQVLAEIKQVSASFATPAAAQVFGNVTVNFRKAKKSVATRYAELLVEMMHYFGNKLSEKMRATHGAISRARESLEAFAFNPASTEDSISFVLLSQELRSKQPRWGEEIKGFHAGQELLVRCRYHFPSDWLETEAIEGEYGAFCDVLNRRLGTVEEISQQLQAQVSDAAKQLEQKLAALEEGWRAAKPLDEKTNYKIANETLQTYRKRVADSATEIARIVKARSALALDVSVAKSEERLHDIESEVNDIGEVWAALTITWQAVDALREMPFRTVAPRRLRKDLEELVEKLQQLPNRIRTYATFNFAKATINGYLRSNLVITDLRSEAIKPRHWDLLKRKLGASWIIDELTLGNIWDCGVHEKESVFREVITLAQGELGLEEFLKQVRELWQTQQKLELVNFQGKTMLVRNWDELFAKVADHLTSLTAMKASPYFREFAAEAATWEDKLSHMQELLEVWVDVQRRWVYLEGVFSTGESAGLLPQETARFRGVNSEFLALMKKAQSSAVAVDVLGIEGIQKVLTRLAEQLARIQKALGEYLERQRVSFPRFFFLGDEDLLEIIGNARDLSKAQKHLKKMFAGTSALCLAVDGTTITGVRSPEGEELRFNQPVCVVSGAGADAKWSTSDQWLTAMETESKHSLAKALSIAVGERESLEDPEKTKSKDALLAWIERTLGQLVDVSAEVCWCSGVERALADEDAKSKAEKLEAIVRGIVSELELLADSVLGELSPITRKKCEHLMATLVHQRDVVRSLAQNGARSTADFSWLQNLRYYYSKSAKDPLAALSIGIANATFSYGWEYLGVFDFIVRTPLIDRVYLTLTQALDARMGGNPFGPAGTGKTECVKALGSQLGKNCLVFCCDKGFSAASMGRILAGLCMVGAFGCFDEFNRLEERTLSAVSQQIQAIQVAIRSVAPNLDLGGGQRVEKLDLSTGVFITLNPGYAGRTNLPDNLKQLFRSVAMITPDREAIAQVMLFSQGFRTAERLASKVVPLFELCLEQLSNQAHYDFGLRALKSVLVSAGNLKRQQLMKHQRETEEGAVPSDEEEDIRAEEQAVMIRSICETTVPKLVSEDIPLLHNLIRDVFPGADVRQMQLSELRAHIAEICSERCLSPASEWVEKLVQLYQIQEIHHGLMLVGPAATGKSEARNVLLEAMEKMDGIVTEQHTIDPKSISKDLLFGTLDQTTREWTDGLFTATLRKIIQSVTEAKVNHRHWIVLDSDVDPIWVENLNSVLDDNKLLTLPNGERLSLPRTVRIVFEVKDLRNATLATVSRCGMVWFSEDIVTPHMVSSQFLKRLHRPSELGAPADAARVRKACADALAPLFLEGGLVERALTDASSRQHVMDFTRMRVLSALFSLLTHGIETLVERNASHPEAPLTTAAIGRGIVSWALFGMSWSIGGSLGLREREEFSRFVHTEALSAGLDPSAREKLPPIGTGAQAKPLLDYGVSIDTGSWFLWETVVPTVDVESHKVGSPDVVIPTVDTTRHVEVMRAWISQRKPFILCGPPGSGKSMTLQSTLATLSGDMDIATLNFSSATTPDLLLKTFSRHCEVKRAPGGETVMRPPGGRWLVVFCDEINLPQADKYGTQQVITFMRQLVERNGFWRFSQQDHTWSWVRLEHVQFVGACNPPTDPGRVPLGERFLRHAPVVLVDFPAEPSLRQIYGTFVRALMRLANTQLRSCATRLTEAMVEWYIRCQRRFTTDVQAHYVFSPRELSRWVRALHESLRTEEKRGSDMELGDLVLLWAHEGLRLFSDRLVEESERHWVDALVKELAGKYFPETTSLFEGIGRAHQNPLLFCDWLSKKYQRVTLEELRTYVKSILRVFYEEELDVPLVLFDEVLEHILRIDRVFHQPQGHALLVGVSGGGKTVLSRFVAWKNALSVFSIKVNNKYKASDFDNDLRTVLRRSGCGDEKICFIFDESNALDSSFLEKMNTLLAAGEVPGLFEGDEWSSLMHQCRDAVQRLGPSTGVDSSSSDDELYRWFVSQVRKNLHVTFTMNPASPDFHNRSATSPALFNRCVIDWFGEWSPRALYQVGCEFTAGLDLDDPAYKPPVLMPPDMPADILGESEGGSGSLTHRQAVVACLVQVHLSIDEANDKLLRLHGRHNYTTPRHFLDLIGHFSKMVGSKRAQLEEEQLHLNLGLEKLLGTENQVKELQAELHRKGQELAAKEQAANEKLSQMLKDQEMAEKKKQDSIKLQEQLAKQKEEIRVRKAKADADLQRAEPALREAQQAVTRIKKQNLDEVRSLPNPPPLVRMTMECVTYMLTGKKLDWAAIRRILTETGFIPSVVNFNTENLTERMRAHVRNTFMSDPKFTFEAVDYASKACGPLFRWIDAQINFSEIKDRVEPLKQEAAALQKAADALQKEADELAATIVALEKSIETYKREYGILIADTKEIEREITHVRSKVDRSIALISNLSEERRRWDSERQTFQQHMKTLVGNVMLCSAALAYSGFFDQRFRTELMNCWMTFAEGMGVQFRQDLSLVDFLSSPEERLQWQANTLPADDLCAANAIMLEHFNNRYPLIIDPSGQAMEFLMNQLREKKITRTSFLDASFMKNLESSLRFGYPLLVQDVESIDPVLNPVLNREIHKKGGRVLIRLGDQEVDFSPSFAIYLFTRDPTAHFTPDLCSRVTLVNFTVTQSSLQEQCLHQVMSSERPEAYRKMGDLARMQGEFRIKLRLLQKRLLAEISQTKGNILDNDTVLATLENLKHEAGEVVDQVRQTEEVMADISKISATYQPMSRACSRAFFALEDLSRIHFLYHFSLRLFLRLFAGVVEGARPKSPEEVAAAQIDVESRTKNLTDTVFRSVFHRACDTLLHEDYTVFGMQLALIRLSGTLNEIDDALVSFLLKAEDISTTQQVPAALTKLGLSDLQWGMLRELAKQGPFKDIDKHILEKPEDWSKWLASPTPEKELLPWSFADHGLSGLPAKSLFCTALLVRVARPDRFSVAVTQFAAAVFGEGFLRSGEPEIARAVAEEPPVTPIMLCSKPGFDSSGKVSAFAETARKPCTALAIGSESFPAVERAILEASKGGEWILLKNVHLAPQWLAQLEKKLHGLTPHPQFRLFMTSEIHPKLPANLLRLSHVLTFEPPPGVLASFRHALGRVSPERMDRAPAERSRLYFMLCWFHAIISERLRYVPHGWTKAFEFGETDQRGGLDTLDTWIDTVAKGRSNIAPERIPWVAIRTLISQTLYGGRVDNPFDQRLLVSVVERLFVPRCFDSGFSLLLSQDTGVSAPDTTTHQDCLRWAETLSASETPAWLGLPEDADLLLMANLTKRVVRKIAKIAGTQFEDKPKPRAVAVAVASASGVPAAKPEMATWLRSLCKDAERWLEQLPSAADASAPMLRQQQQQTALGQQGTLEVIWRCLERDARAGLQLVGKVRAELEEMLDAAKGNRKQTNHTRALADELSRGIVPRAWRVYAVPELLSVGGFVRDLARRATQFKKILDADRQQQSRVWLGGLLHPEAFVTATRQAASRANKCSLETLRLEVSAINTSLDKPLRPEEFAVDGMALENAAIADDGTLVAGSSSTALPLGTVVFAWKPQPPTSAAAETPDEVQIPVYHNETRTEVIFTAGLRTSADVHKEQWYKRSVAITCWRS